MNREDIIRMAWKAGFERLGHTNNDWVCYPEDIERFAALVASAERESLRESFRVVTAAEASAAILHEREACARVCDDIHAKYKWPQDTAEKVASQWCADAIRARGQA